MTSSHIKPRLHGWLILDKPLGLTSTQALGKARRLLGGKKAGHGGTLDPLATGVLPLAFGEATKLISHVMDGDKEYEFTIRWGEARDTDDAEGKVTAESDHRPTEEAIRTALKSFVGTIQQTPPIFSAIKLGGERAYDIARDGGVPEMTPRPVAIHEITLLNNSIYEASFRVLCGKGMYVRSLARDLALILETYGYVSSLRRTRVGPFTLENASLIESLENHQKANGTHLPLLPLKAVLGNIPVLNLLPAEAQSLRLGQGILIRPQHIQLIDNSIIFAEHQQVPVALVEPRAGEFRVLRGFYFD